jgi:hypothetical protein
MKKIALLLLALISNFTLSAYAEEKLKWGEVATIDGPQPMFYKAITRADGSREYLTHDDILVEPITSNKATSRSCKHYLWKDGVVPFELDPTTPNQARLWEAVAYFEKYTTIRLVPRTDEKDFVYIKNNGDADCSSFVGKKGGRQTLNLSSWCGTGSLIHEFMHALGFWHEQSRPDRRKWINVQWMNIQLKRWGNFMSVPFAKTYGEFDFKSIMLYPSYNGFARNLEKPTMITRQSKETWGSQRAGLSAGDLLALELLYKKAD